MTVAVILTSSREKFKHAVGRGSQSEAVLQFRFVMRRRASGRRPRKNVEVLELKIRPAHTRKFRNRKDTHDANSM